MSNLPPYSSFACSLKIGNRDPIAVKRFEVRLDIPSELINDDSQAGKTIVEPDKLTGHCFTK